jgi:hypothetical protein
MSSPEKHSALKAVQASCALEGSLKKLQLMAETLRLPAALQTAHGFSIRSGVGRKRQQEIGNGRMGSQWGDFLMSNVTQVYGKVE